MRSRTFKLCLNAGSGSAPYINVNQYDEGETWLFELYSENGERYIPSSGAIVGVKSDGHGIANTGTVDSEGRVVITETQQMTASAGRAIYELSIDGLTHGTANFIVAVERKPTDDAVMSDSDLSLIQEAIDSAEVIVEVIGDGDPSEVIGEHVDAWLDNHPEATTTVEDGAITAPKINQSLWDKLLVSESASGNPASFDDGADDVPVSSLKVTLEPVQLGSGDPSPSNVRPIIAANGKNLFDESLFDTHVTTLTYQSFAIPNGLYTMSSDFPIVGNTTNVFFLAGQVTSGAATVYNGVYANHPITMEITDGYYTVAYRSTYANNPNDPKDYQFQIERGSSASPYQPYQGITVERTGKNIFDQSKVVQGTIGGIGVDMGSLTRLRTPFIKVKPSTKYAFQCNSELQLFEIHEYDENNEWQRYKTVNATSYIYTSGANAHYIKFLIRYADNSTILPSALTAGMVEEGDTVSEYEPYTSTSYPYTLGQSVYGGTVDLTTGVLTVTHGIVDMGTLTYTYRNSFGMHTNGLSATIKNPSSNDKPVNAISSIAKAGSWTVLVNSGTASGLFGVSGGYLGIATTETNPTTFKTAVTGQTICYELVEPQTIQLTPTEVKTLLGYNNISSSGTVDVIYHADTKLYVDKMTAVDNNIIAPTEADFVATRNYTVNDLVIVNDTLYKVTANIASGSAITPNSNVTATTLSALIKALS